jgi:hypothetical protein
MRWMVALATIALVSCHRDDPPRAVPAEHGTGAVAQAETPAGDDLRCLSHGEATTADDYHAIARRVTQRIASLSDRFPALDDLDVDDLHGPPSESRDAIQFDLRFSHGVAWEKPQAGGPGKLKSMEPRYESDEAVDLSIAFFAGPDMGRLMVPLVAIGAMNAKLMVTSPRAEELVPVIRAILLDEARRFAACT